MQTTLDKTSDMAWQTNNPWAVAAALRDRGLDGYAMRSLAAEAARFRDGDREITIFKSGRIRCKGRGSIGVIRAIAAEVTR